jgi:hypothetical protein
MSTWIYRLITVLLLGVAVLDGTARTAGGGAAAIHAAEKPAIAVLIGALNDCIQERFKEVDQLFGMRRLVPPGYTAHRFHPETVREVAAVSDLDRAGMRVVLYLSGRDILRPQLDRARLSDEAMWRLIKGPVLIAPSAAAAASARDRADNGASNEPPRFTDDGSVTIHTSHFRVAGGTDPGWSSGRAEGVPDPRNLFDQTRAAMAAFAKVNAHDFRIADWSFSARAVRASSAACLRCHYEDGVSPLRSVRSTLQIGDPLGVVLYGYQPAK